MWHNDNHGLVVRFHSEGNFGMVRRAAVAHRTPLKTPCPKLGKRPCDLPIISDSDIAGMDSTYMSQPMPASAVIETVTRRPRVAGDPSAALWASLVLSRALCS